MEPLLHNDYRQQPITSAEAHSHYRHYLAQLEALIANQEDVVHQARLAGDAAALAEARTSLWRLLTKRQGVADQVTAYARQHVGVQ